MDNKTFLDHYHQLRHAVYQQSNSIVNETIDLTNNDSKLDSEGSTIELVDEVKPYKSLY